MSDLMTKAEVAELLRVSLRTVSRLELPHTMIGRLPRYSRLAIEAWVAARSVEPRPKGKAAHRAAPRLTGRTTTSAEFLAELRRSLTRR